VPLRVGAALECPRCACRYPIEDGVPRFVPPDHYTASFGFQWNLHRDTQLDSRSGTTISRDRVVRQTGWPLESLRGRAVLECGSGAGRFTEVLCAAGAVVTSVDASSAVRANKASNGRFPDLRLIQASIYDLPLPDAAFDDLVCFGVIQHTPDVERAFKAMFRPLKPGGRFCIDVYAAPLSYLHPRHLLRPVARRIDPPTLYRAVEAVVPRLLPLSTRLYAVPVVGQALARLVPVANWRHLPLPREEDYRTWAVLDTFDWLSARYESPQPRRRLLRWARDLGLRQAEVVRQRGIYVVRGVK
jgi:SAM-dependent methyltransferase